MARFFYAKKPHAGVVCGWRPGQVSASTLACLPRGRGTRGILTRVCAVDWRIHKGWCLGPMPCVREIYDCTESLYI